MPIPASVNSLPAVALRTVESLPFPKIATGKVREIFDLGDRLLLIATDRLSAFDVVLPDGIPGKGIVLTQISLFWFNELAGILPNHLVPDHDAALAEVLKDHRDLIPRSMLVKKLRPLPIEAVVRGALAGSGWKDYQRTGKLFGQTVPAGLRESERFARPYFTPTTKAAAGHDEALTLEGCAAILGQARFEEVRDKALTVFSHGSIFAAKRGLVLADSKFEFGLDDNGKLHLIDEVLTPDSSRYWPGASYLAGGPQHAFDKQYVRDYLETLNWDKRPPGPKLPAEVIQVTQARYVEAWRMLTNG